MKACPSCGAELASPLVCEACGALQRAPASASPFALFGLEPSFALDRAALDKRHLRLSRRLHPDFFAGAQAAERALAEDNTARLNAALELLRDDFRRADWLVRELGGPGENDERQMPQAFLIEVLEWNETIDAARDATEGAPERAAVESLASTLEDERARLFEEIGAVLTPLPAAGSEALRELRRKLNAVRYLDRSLHEIRELALRTAR